MTTPRALLIDSQASGYYHLISRCVRKSWLCGRKGSHNYNHRKAWLTERLKQLGQAFAVDIHAYAIMSNHFHLVIYSDPLAPSSWSDDEVVSRWLASCPPRNSSGEFDPVRYEVLRQRLLSDPDQLAQLRRKLGSVSVFMKLLKQPIARRANLEDDCKGHFFEQRFYSGALLDDAAIVAAMAYVDLNPIRAKIAESLEESDNTSAQHRLKNSEAAINDYLAPVISGLDEPSAAPIKTDEYFRRLRAVIHTSDRTNQDSASRRFQSHLACLRTRQRAYGALNALRDWIATRGLQLRESPLA